MNPKVDVLLKKSKSGKRWQEELGKLRAIVLDCGLTEEIKWRHPCYTFQNRNVAIIGGFKEWCALSFFKGALLKDPKGLLEMPGENTQAGRVVRFRSPSEIAAMETDLRALIREAIAVEKSGRRVTFKKITEHKVPDELQEKLRENPALEKAFRALTPGRQREYLLHFSAPKQPATRVSRIERSVEKILRGEGLHDQYRRGKRK